MSRRLYSRRLTNITIKLFDMVYDKSTSIQEDYYGLQVVINNSISALLLLYTVTSVISYNVILNMCDLVFISRWQVCIRTPATCLFYSQMAGIHTYASNLFVLFTNGGYTYIRTPATCSFYSQMAGIHTYASNLFVLFTNCGYTYIRTPATCSFYSQIAGIHTYTSNLFVFSISR